ncbi:response regulator transcription factor [Clostridium colicanis]|uniref:Stage 0 sporulation protein A homolog n=1 Tax=Clostridium colicanis DSM 13634 TaxID=1121305 RepID=A0A151APY1_9CLOT|nr:response regulator [Clostridium colicanis]KYH29457.1 putative response regulatory protein [Clostridium colicanis DSM 13634]
MIKVLVVDDEYFAREGMKRTVPWEKYGCTICGEAQDGREGIEEAKKHKPDLIITDISMPEVNGIDMVKEISKFLPNCKFIIITGHDEFKYVKAAIKLRAVDFILKPIDDDEFLEAVNRAVEDLRKLNVSNNIRISKEDIIKLSDIMKEEKELLFAVKAFDRINMEKNLKHIFFNILEGNRSNYEIVKQVSIDIVLKAVNMLNEYNISFENVLNSDLDAYKKSYTASNIKEAYDWVHKILSNILDAIKEAVMEANETGIEKAIEYIEEHFCENISLSDVAKRVYLSESYLSRKFKKVKGMGFVEYITKLRMEKAIEDLKNPNIKIADLASKLGYPNYRYFSQSFKKYTNYTPSEFIKINK